ncbi:DUF4153 domain-containing protein, partial [Treponema sp. R8-4-B8]
MLYVYLFKIIAAWELPKGLVSWLVSSLACVGFLTTWILYPARMEGKNKTVVYMSRGFGLIMLPLLALMTVGIFRRVDDYGITVLRGYLIVINIWLYGVCVYQFITKARRVKWIIISYAVFCLKKKKKRKERDSASKHIHKLAGNRELRYFSRTHTARCADHVISSTLNCPPAQTKSQPH